MGTESKKAQPQNCIVQTSPSRDTGKSVDLGGGKNEYPESTLSPSIGGSLRLYSVKRKGKISVLGGGENCKKKKSSNVLFRPFLRFFYLPLQLQKKLFLLQNNRPKLSTTVK